MYRYMRQTAILISVLKGQDIVILLKLVDVDHDWTIRSLAAELGLPAAGVQRSVQRLSAAGLFDQQRRRTNVSQAEEFLVHAVKYLFPPELEGETRGFPTAWAAPPLAGEMAPLGDLPPVWPHPQGAQRGIALTPLHPAVPGLAHRDPGLAERLALIDAIRMGDARVRAVATALLRDRLERGPTSS